MFSDSTVFYCLAKAVEGKTRAAPSVGITGTAPAFKTSDWRPASTDGSESCADVEKRLVAPLGVVDPELVEAVRLWRVLLRSTTRPLW